MSTTLKKWLAGIIAVIAVCLGGIGVVTLTNEDGTVTVNGEFSIEYSQESLPAVIETTEETEELDVPTVEAVDEGQEIEECGEDEECGQGWWVDTSSAEAFKNATLGKCVDTDGHYGSQCWDLGNLFWQNYTGRTLSTCGTGAAKGILNCYEYNAGNEFTMIWNYADIQAGDWLIFGNGQYGHIGMALGGVHNGYVALLGANQGGGYCTGGGSSVNIINISIANFTGAFRPNSYIVPEPTPEPEPTPVTEVTYTYVKGDYFSKVLVNLGLDEGKLWGTDGTVAYYTQQLVEQDVLDSRGNVKIGVPFTLKLR